MLTSILNFFSPIGTLPGLNGHHAVASEIISINPHRLLQVKLFYPTDLSKLDEEKYKIGSYADRKLFPYWSKVFKFPQSIMEHYMTIGVNFYERANTTDELLPLITDLQQLPVVIFSPGWTGTPENYSVIAEQLASYGFIVLSIYHTDGSCPIVLTDNGSIPFDHKITEFVDPNEKDAKVKEKKLEEYRGHQLKIRCQDVLDCVKYLEGITNGTETTGSEASKLLQGRIDMNKLACVGHSFGGGTTVGALSYMNDNNEPYFKIGISLDGWMIPLLQEDVSQLESGEITTSSEDSFVYRYNKMKKQSSICPSIAFINSEVWQWDKNREVMKQIAKFLQTPDKETGNHQKVQYLWAIPNTGHHNYNDLGVLMPKMGRYVKLLTTNIDHVQHKIELCDLVKDVIESHLDPSIPANKRFEQHLI